MDVPQARVAVIDGTAHAPGQPWKHGKQTIKTLWGELAWQLGGGDGFALVKDADASGTSPGKEVLRDLLAAYAPCVVLIDELVAYIRQFPEGQPLERRHLRQQPLVRPGADRGGEAGADTRSCWPRCPSQMSRRAASVASAALRALEKTFGRVQALWKPVATEEAFEIVRRRLFEPMRDAKARDAVCRAFADAYVAEGAKLPSETQEGALLRPARAGVPDSPRGVRPPLRGLDDHRRLPAHPRRAEADGQGHLPALEGRQQGSDDPAGEPAAGRRRRAQRADLLLAAGMGPGDRAGHRRRPGRDDGAGGQGAAVRAGERGPPGGADAFPRAAPRRRWRRSPASAGWTAAGCCSAACSRARRRRSMPTR